MKAQQQARQPPPSISAEPDSALAQGRFTGREAFREQLRQAFAMAPARRWKRVVLCDADFADWPLGERETEARLDAWARTGAHFTLLAQDYHEVLRRHARFVRWRARWSHQIECHSAGQRVSAADFPSVCWTPDWVLQRVDPLASVCVAGCDARQRVELHERLERWLRSATPAFPATTLGL